MENKEEIVQGNCFHLSKLVDCESSSKKMKTKTKEFLKRSEILTLLLLSSTLFNIFVCPFKHHKMNK